MTNKQLDYYGEDINCIHLKFGDVRKHYNFTKDFVEKYPVFAREYAIYFTCNQENNISQFKNPLQVVRYVYANNLPVYFYYNFTDTPAKDEQEIMAYLVREMSYISNLE